jgi:hypothetical protein
MRRRNITHLWPQFGRELAPDLTNEQIAEALERAGLIEVQGNSYYETRKMRDIPKDEFMRVISLVLGGAK